MFIRFVVLTLLCVLGSGGVFAKAEEIEKKKSSKEGSKESHNNRDLVQLVERLEKINSISGEFVQLSIDQKGVLIQEARGEFIAQRPGQFYWYTKEPLEQGIYSTGKQVIIYDPDLEQATVQKMSDQIQNTPAVLFSGDVSKIGDSFKVEMRQFDDLNTQFILYPKEKDSLFELMKIRFEAGHVAEMHLSDSLGQKNSVNFIHTRINEAFPESVFSPDFPEGTDIIRDLPAELTP